MAESITVQEISDLITGIRALGKGKDLLITSTGNPYEGRYYHWINLTISKANGDDVTDSEAKSLTKEIQDLMDDKGFEASASLTPYEGYRFYSISLSVRRKEIWVSTDGTVYE